MSFQPGISEVSLNYGVKTSGAKLKLATTSDSIERNAFGYSLSNYPEWGSGKENGEIWMRLNDGYITRDILGLLPDKKFLGGNSIVYAAMKDVVNDSAQIVVLLYRNLDEAARIPSNLSWERDFFKVNNWLVNEKILATLSPF